MHQIRFSAGALPQTPLRELTALPQTPLLCLREATSKGWGGREKEKGRGKGPPFHVGIEPPVQGLIRQWVQDGAIVTMESE